MNKRCTCLSTLVLAFLFAAPLSAWADYQVWVWANNPRAPSYKPSAQYMNNPRGPVRVKRRGPGEYVVEFSGVGKGTKSGGNVQVTSYGPGNHWCKVVSWTGKLNVKVKCFDTHGRPKDGQFTALVTMAGRGGRGNSRTVAYAWGNNKTGSSYTASSQYAHNFGQPVQVRRNGVGKYEVVFTGLASRGAKNGGNVQVTGYGADRARCKVERWSPSGGNLSVRVACYDGGGRPVDAQYSVLVTF